MPRSRKRTRTAAASDDESDDAQDVAPAVLQRARRSTAGKRMSTLVGKAQEDDEMFWSHPVWSEGGSTRTRGGREAANNRNLKKRRRDNEDGSGSSSDDDDDDSLSEGEASYRISDEDSEAAVDQFDSDFDETESEDENENDGDFGGKAGGDGLGQEERELRAEERREANAKRKKDQKFGTYSGMAKSLAGQASTASAGRQLMKRKEGSRSKRGTVTKRGVLGTGWNEGLVLNWPSHEDTSMSTLKQPANDTPAVDSSHSTIAKPISEELGIMASTMASCKSTTPSSSVTQHNIKIPIDSAKAITSQQSMQTLSTHSNGANFPTAQSSLQLQDGPTPLPPLDSKLPTIGVNAIPPTKRHPPKLPQQHQPNQNRTSPTRRRNLRAGTVSKSKATANSVAQSTKLTQIRQAAYHEKKKSQSSKNKRHFTQEELIMEAIQKTEIENAKWLFARKRRKEEVAQMENHTSGGGKKSKASSGGSSDASVTPVSRFYSRRGYHNILTFMDMDHLPDIFTRRNSSHVEAVRPQEHHGIESGSTRQPLTQNQLLSTESNKKNIDKSPFQSGKTNTICIITGKVAKYRDPKTQLGYHDIDAFRELRRRLEAGELPGFETWRNEPSQQTQKQPILPTQPSADNHNIQPRNGHGNGHNLRLVQHSDSFCFAPTRERQHVDQQLLTQQQIIDAGSSNGMHDTSPLKEMTTKQNDNSTMKQSYATLN